MAERDSWGIWDGHVHTVILKMGNQQGLIVERRNSASCYVAAWMGGEFGGRMDPCVCMSGFLFCLPETITALLISYTPI